MSGAIAGSGLQGCERSFIQDKEEQCGMSMNDIVV
jgi:hypothetical protein